MGKISFLSNLFLYPITIKLDINNENIKNKKLLRTILFIIIINIFLLKKYYKFILII